MELATKGFSHGHVPVTALKVWGKGNRSYAFSEDFEDKSVLKTLCHSPRVPEWIVASALMHHV